VAKQGNILNLVVQRFPPGWRYGAIIDGDFHMTRRDWALEAIHQLQHYDFVQLFFRLFGSFRRALSLPRDAELRIQLREWSREFGLSSEASHRSRRSAFDAVGGLLDVCILGSADWHMAFGLVGAVDAPSELQWCSKPYVEAVLRWQERAALLKRNIGYVDNHAIHYFHGSKVSRSYGSRWHILLDNKYDPRTDISRDWQGVYQFTGNKPRLRDDIRGYFRDRNEDSPELSPQERHII